MHTRAATGAPPVLLALLAAAAAVCAASEGGVGFTEYHPSVVVTPCLATWGGGGEICFTASFNAAVSGVSTAGVTYSGAVTSIVSVTANSATAYTILVLAGFGNVTVGMGVGAGIAISDGTSTSDASNAATSIYAPTIIMSTDNNNAHDCSSTFRVHFVLTHALTGFTVGDISVAGGGTLGGFTLGSSAGHVDVTPTSEITLSLSIAPDAGTDGEYGTAAATTLSVTPACIPRVRLTPGPGVRWHDGLRAVTIYMHASHPIDVGTISAGSFVGTGGSPGNLVAMDGSAHKFWAVDLTPAGCVPMNFSVPSGTFANAADDRSSEASNGLVVQCKIPRFRLSYGAGNHGEHAGAGGAPVTAIITTVVPVTGFVQGDLSLVGCTVASFTAGTGARAGMLWIVLLQPTSNNAMNIDIAGGVAANAVDTAILNLPTEFSLVWAFSRSVGLFEVTSMTIDSTTGGTVYAPVLSGVLPDPVLATFTAPVYAYGPDVRLCVTRRADPQTPMSAVTGRAVLRVNVSDTVSDLILTGDTDGVSGLEFVETALTAGYTFYWVWTDEELAGTQKCLWMRRTSMSVAAVDACGATSSFSLHLRMHTTEIDPLCVNGAEGCADNARYFVDGVHTVVCASSATLSPAVKLMSSAALNAHFATDDAPPPLSRAQWAQGPTVVALGFQRTCGSADMSSLGNVLMELWADDTVLHLEELFVDQLGSLAGSVTFVDITPDFTDTYQTVRQGLSWANISADYNNGGPQHVRSVTWPGATCGPNFIRVVMADVRPGGAVLSSPDTARLGFSFAGALATCNNGSEYVDPAPPVQLSVRNDPTRDGDGSAAVGVVFPHLDVYSCAGISYDADWGTLSGCVGVVANEVSDSPPAQHTITVVSFGTSGVPAGGLWDDLLDRDMCTSLGAAYWSAVQDVDPPVHSAAAVFDAAFGGAWPDNLASYVANNATYSWNSGEPFYPTAPVEFAGPWHSDWEVVPTGAGIFAGVPSGGYGLSLAFTATLPEMKDCANYDGTPAVVTSNDEGSDAVLETISITVQRFTYDGALSNRRMVELAHKTFVITVQAPGMTTVSQASIVARDVQLTAAALNTDITVAPCATANYASFASYTGLDLTDHAVSAGGAAARCYAPQFRVRVTIPRTATASTDGDVCILAPGYLPFQRGDPSDQTPGHLTPYGIQPRGGSVVLVNGYDENTAFNLYDVTVMGAVVNAYSLAASAIDYTVFQSASDSAYRNDFSFQLSLVQAPVGVSCAAALARRLLPGAYTLVRQQTIGLTATLAITPRASVFDAVGWTKAVLEVYKVPDVQDAAGTWRTVDGVIPPLKTFTTDTQFNLATDTPVPLMRSDSIALTLRGESAAMLNVLDGFLRNAAGSTLNPASEYACCVTAAYTGGCAECPEDAIIARSLDPIVWAIWIAASNTPAAINPIKAYYPVVSEYLPGFAWASGAQPAPVVQSGRWSVESVFQKRVVGNLEAMCGNAADADYRLGAASAVYTDAKLADRADSFWHHLSGLVTDTNGGSEVLAYAPFRFADGFATTVSGFDTSGPIVWTLDLTVVDCSQYGTGSHYRALRQSKTRQTDAETMKAAADGAAAAAMVHRRAAAAAAASAAASDTGAKSGPWGAAAAASAAASDTGAKSGPWGAAAASRRAAVAAAKAAMREASPPARRADVVGSTTAAASYTLTAQGAITFITLTNSSIHTTVVDSGGGTNALMSSLAAFGRTGAGILTYSSSGVVLLFLGCGVCFYLGRRRRQRDPRDDKL